MDKRPRSIMVIGWIFVVFGSAAVIASLLSIAYAGEAHRAADLKAHWMIHVSRILALLGGVFLLQGFNWARWLLVAWLAFHVVISFFHSPVELLAHSLFLVASSYFLFRPLASEYFSGIKASERANADGWD